MNQPDLCAPSVFSRRCWHLTISTVICAIAILAGSGIVFGQTTRQYVPALQATNSADLRITLLNPTALNVRVTLTARTYSGDVIQGAGIVNPVARVLPASSTTAFSRAEIFGDGISSQAGWVEVSTSSPEVRGFFEVYDSARTFLDSAALSATPSSRIIFPKVSASSQSRLHLVNIAQEAVQGEIALYDNSGNLVVVGPVALSGFSGFSGTIDELLPPAVVAGFEGYAVVQTGDDVVPGPESLVGFEAYQNIADIAVVRAVPDRARLRTGYIPFLASQSGYSSRLTIINSSDDSQSLQITANALRAGETALNPSTITVQRTLDPNSRLEETVAQMFGLSGDTVITGYIRFETQDLTPGTIAILEYGATDGRFLSAIEAQPTGYSDVHFSEVADGNGYFTGVALLNADSNPATVTLDVFDAAGSRTGSADINLNPGELKTNLLDSFVQAPIVQAGGDVHVTTQGPIFALQLIGSTDSGLLSNVAPLGVSSPATTSVDAIPSITAISPSIVFAETTVQISGTGFTPESVVDYDGMKIRSSFIDSTLLVITLLTPQLQAGPHTIQINNLSGGSDVITLTVDATIDSSALSADASLASTTLTGRSRGRKNRAPVVSAGIAQTITLPATATLSGTATDDGLPSGSLTTAWSKSSGPGTVTFGNINALSTTATFSIDGTYVLQLSASDGALTSTSTVTMTVNPDSLSSPGVLTISTPLALDKTTVTIGQTLTATVTYQNTGSSPVTVNDIWITSRPPGGTNSSGPFYDLAPSMPTTTIQPGATVKLSASRAFTSTDPTGIWYAYGTYQDSSQVWHDAPNVNFTVQAASVVNQAPVVSAGANQTITLPSTATLSGTATDDGLPSGTLTTTWSMSSGPGTVTFGNVSALSTTASFTTAGTYLLQLSASDGALKSTSTVTITVNPDPPSTGLLTISTPLALDKTTVTIGQTLNATVTYRNTSSSPVTVNQIAITSRPPGGTNSGGPFDDLSPALGSTTVQAGATVTLSASRTFTSTDSTGTWYAYATYEDTASAWHNGPNVNFTVSAPVSGGGGGSPPPANAFYVSTTGSDSNSGSSSSPWRTIQRAANTVSAGATVIVSAGTYSERVSLSRSGSSSSPITFQAQGSVVMKGFSITGSYVIVDGFEPSNIAASGFAPASYAGIYSSGGHNIIRNNYSHNNGSIGIYLDTPSSFNQVLNNVIAYNGDVGIWTRGSDHLIQKNDISHTIQIPANWSNPPNWADADGIYFEGARHVFKGNYIHDITFADAGQACSFCQQTVPHRDAFQESGDSSDVIVDGNLIHIPYKQQWTSQMMMISSTHTNLMIRNNIVYNTDRGPNIYGTFIGLKIENNTFVNITDYAVDIEATGGNNVLVRNNIFRNVRTPAVDVVSATATQDHNFTGDPMFVNEAGLDFHLKSGSPAIDTGLNTSDVTQDYDGVSRPQGSSTDIGANEYHP